MTLAFHEMAHDTDDTGTHFHGMEFYQAYHDMTRGRALHWISTLSYKMRTQRNIDQATVKLEQEAKKEARRERKLGVAMAVKRLTHTPTKAITPKRVAKKKRSRRRMRF